MYVRTTGNTMRALETHDQRLHRLAQEARHQGLQILEDETANRAYCTSYSQPDRLHAVSFVDCSCIGFRHIGICRHHALFLWSRSALPVLPGTAKIVPFRKRISDFTPRTAA